MVCQDSANSLKEFGRPVVIRYINHGKEVFSPIHVYKRIDQVSIRTRNLSKTLSTYMFDFISLDPFNESSCP